jgi:hypothetical protein
VSLADHINRRDTRSINRIGDDLAVVQIALKKSLEQDEIENERRTILEEDNESDTSSSSEEDDDEEFNVTNRKKPSQTLTEPRKRKDTIDKKE